MFRREKIEEILHRAECIDPEYGLFGASRHHYKLNPPVEIAFVRKVEETYCFTLPDDYVRFITEIGDGGAGPSYGLYSFGNILRKGKSPRVEQYWEEYRYGLAKEFIVEPMSADMLVEEYCSISKEEYYKNPGKYFVNNSESDRNGFYVLGTRGCALDFGLITAGEKRGQVFDTDNEGVYCFTAGSFDEFYQNWLDLISDTERLRKMLRK